MNIPTIQLIVGTTFVVLACFVIITRTFATKVTPYIASLYSLTCVILAFVSALELIAKISTGQETYVYLTLSLPPVIGYFASSIIMLASIPWFYLVAKRGEK